jgi:hypothetical protein
MDNEEREHSNPSGTSDRGASVRVSRRRLRERTADVSHAGGNVPAAVRIPAWLLLVAFWGYLGYRQYTQPWVTFEWNDILKRLPKRTATPAPPKRVAPAPAPSPPVASPEPLPVIAEAEPPPVPTPPRLTDDQRKLIEEAKQQVAAALLAGDTATARDAVHALAPDASAPAVVPARDELLAFVDTVSDVDRLVADAFRARIGSEVTVNFHGVAQRLVPRSVSEYTINAELLQDAGAGAERVPVSFQPAELAPAEKVRWLGDIEPAAASAVRLLLNVRDGRLDEARALAPSCGPLADAFQQQL